MIGILESYSDHRPGEWSDRGSTVPDFERYAYVKDADIISVASYLPRKSLEERAATSHYHLPHCRVSGATAGAVPRGQAASYVGKW